MVWYANIHLQAVLIFVWLCGWIDTENKASLSSTESGAELGKNEHPDMPQYYVEKTSNAMERIRAHSLK